MAIQPVGFEPTIADSKGRCLEPIWLWLQNKTGMGGFEPPTIRLTAERSTTKLHANKIHKTRRGTEPPTNDCMEKVWWLAPIRNGSSSCVPSRLLPFCLSYQEGRI